MFTSTIFVSCSSEKKAEVKRVTAIGLGNGLSSFLMNENPFFCEDKPIMVCDDPIKAQEYIVEKSCDLLKADCEMHMSFQASKNKNVIKQFLCKSAVNIVMPAIFPSQQLPSELKAAGCRSECLDNLSVEFAQGLCSKL